MTAGWWGAGCSVHGGRGHHVPCNCVVAPGIPLVVFEGAGDHKVGAGWGEA